MILIVALDVCAAQGFHRGYLRSITTLSDDVLARFRLFGTKLAVANPNTGVTQQALQEYTPDALLELAKDLGVDASGDLVEDILARIESDFVATGDDVDGVTLCYIAECLSHLSSSGTQRHAHAPVILNFQHRFPFFKIEPKIMIRNVFCTQAPTGAA